MIYNRSGHPIEVKKISVRVWSIRDEIEAALERRMKECEAAGVPLYIDDIKDYYRLSKNQAALADNVLPLTAKEAGNSEDEGMANLMESLGSQDPAEASAENEATPEPPVETSAEESTETPSEALSEAEGIIADQKSQGLQTEKPNPILQRPYQRQAPDSNRVSYGFTLLSDINMDTFLSFNQHKFLQGQCIVIEFLIPQSFMMTASVVSCLHIALRSRIISSTKPDYRLQCRFSYDIPGERDTLRNFLKSVEPVLPPERKKKAKEKDPEDDLLGL